MKKLTVFVTAIATASIFIDKADSLPNVDIQNLLQSLQQQIHLEQKRPRQKHLVEDDENESHFGSLTNKDLSKLLGLTSNKYKINGYSNKKNKGRGNQQNLEEYLLNRRPNPEDKKYPNNLLALNNKGFGDTQDRSSLEDDSREDGGPDGYSKVYVVLNSDAVRKTKNRDKLNALLSSLLSLPPDHNQGDHNNQDSASYKGFTVSDDMIWRRLNRDSNEIYAKDPVVEKERPMRMREAQVSRGRVRGRDRGRSGGGSGRTAIPYIRQRGDIYERDE